MLMLELGAQVSATDRRLFRLGRDGDRHCEFRWRVPRFSLFFCDFGDVCAFTHIPNYPAARFVEFFALACWNLELISGQLGISLQ